MTQLIGDSQAIAEFSNAHLELFADLEAQAAAVSPLPPQVEIDEAPNKLGEYRVWWGMAVIGIVFQNPDGSWLSQSKRNDWQPKPRQTSEEAIAAIIEFLQPIPQEKPLDKEPELTYSESPHSDNELQLYHLWRGDKYLGRLTGNSKGWSHDRTKSIFPTREAAGLDLAELKRRENEVFQRSNDLLLGGAS